MNRFLSSLAVVLFGLSLACRESTGIVPPAPPPPPVEPVLPLTVELSGQLKIERAGAYFYHARASGGSGEYQFGWEVSSGPVAAAMRTTEPEPVTYVIPDGYYMLHVSRGDGDLIVKVVVTAGSEQVSKSMFVRNCIGGCTQP